MGAQTGWQVMDGGPVDGHGYPSLPSIGASLSWESSQQMLLHRSGLLAGWLLSIATAALAQYPLWSLWNAIS